MEQLKKLLLLFLDTTKAAKKEKTIRISSTVKVQKQAAKGFDTDRKPLNTSLPADLGVQLKFEKLQKVVDGFNKKSKKLIDELSLLKDNVYNADNILMSDEDLTKK